MTHEAVEEMARDWAAKKAKQQQLAAAADASAEEGAAAERSSQRAGEAEGLRELLEDIRAGRVVEPGQVIQFAKLFKVGHSAGGSGGGWGASPC